jgi:hypothetical protein
MTTYEKFKASAICCLCLFLICASFACLQARELMIAGWSGIPAKINSTLDSLVGVGPKAMATLDTINAPCTDFHGDYSCGALAQLSQTEKNFGIVAALSAEQVKQSGQLITGAVSNMNEVGSHVSEVADVLKGTATAATGTIDQAHTDLATLDTSLAEVPPLVTHLDTMATTGNTSLDDLNKLLANPSLALMETNFASITDSGKDIAATTDAVEKKLTQCTLHPTFACSFRSDAIFGAQVGGYILSGLKP